MLCYVILHYILSVLYCIVLYCIKLRCIVLYYIILHYIILHCIVLYYIVSYIPRAPHRSELGCSGQIGAARGGSLPSMASDRVVQRAKTHLIPSGRIAHGRIASHCIASGRIRSHLAASHCIWSHRIASGRIWPHRAASGRLWASSAAREVTAARREPQASTTSPDAGSSAASAGAAAAPPLKAPTPPKGLTAALKGRPPPTPAKAPLRLGAAELGGGRPGMGSDWMWAAEAREYTCAGIGSDTDRIESDAAQISGTAQIWFGPDIWYGPNLRYGLSHGARCGGPGHISAKNPQPGRRGGRAEPASKLARAGRELCGGGTSAVRESAGGYE